HSGNVSTFSNGFTLTSASLQRQRKNQNDDPTGIEQWLQIQNAKLQEDSPLRAIPASNQAPTLGAQPGAAPSSPLAIWTSGSISMGDSGDASDSDQAFLTSGLSAGADYRWTPKLTVGLGFGYGRDKTDIGDNGSRSQADSYSLALYSSYRPIESIYLDAVLGYQRLSFDTRRYITDNANTVNGDRDGDLTFASLALGYEYRQEHWMLSPYARLDLTHGTLDSYEERGDAIFALRYEEQTVKTTSTSLGLRGEYAQTTAIGELTPSLRLEYQHDFQGDGDAAMRYVNGDTLYRSTLEALGQDRGVFGLGLGLLTEANWSLRMEYQYTLSSGSQQAQSMLFSLRKPF
ncbi:autotransporter outer membrane beta-barrel domain-containing protein, partial [Pseudomonas guineae]|uniref:autotransporter outer membrane beta-barrel domain-containing protein n=1 Tax=Pseudomonas guineae TaxID=425504 RepID=UPI0030EF0B3E